MLSVIIPTLNAARSLQATLDSLGRGRNGLPIELIIADGGSQDDTVLVAARLGARLVSSKQGRGRQLAAGAKAASGDWFLFLHADTHLPSDWADRVVAHQNTQTDKAGWFALKFDAVGFWARRVERRAAWRSRAGLPFGDQALLISRALYGEVGGYADIPLFEDVDLARRLGRGRMTSLGASVTTSAERYVRDGWVRRQVKNFICFSLYRLGVPAHHIVRIYR